MGILDLVGGKFMSTTGFPFWGAVLQQGQSDAANTANINNINDIVGALQTFGGDLGKYLDQTQGAGLTYLVNLARTGRANLNAAMATSMTGAPLEYFTSVNWSDPATLMAALTPTTTTGNGIVPGESTFDLSWLPDNVRKDAEAWRWWQGPESMIGKAKGYTESQYNADLWKQFGDYAPAAVADSTTYIGPITGKTYADMTPEEIWGQEYATLGIRVDESGQPVQADLEKYLTSEGYLTEGPGTEDIDEAISGWKGRYTAGMKLLETTGEQAKEDIRTEFSNVSSEAEQSMIDRGLYGTTIAPSVQSGIAQREVSALDRLNETLREEKLNWQSMLSSDYLEKMDKWLTTGLNYDATMGQTVYNEFTGGVDDRINLATNLANTIAGLRSSITYAGPEQVNWANVFGGISNARSAWDVANQSDNSSMWTGIGGVAGSASLIGDLALGTDPATAMLAAMGLNQGLSSIGLFR